MTLENAVITVEKQIGPGVSVHITGVPVEIVRAAGKDDLTLFDWDTSRRLWRMVRLARGRMAAGETQFQYDFTDAL